MLTTRHLRTGAAAAALILSLAACGASQDESPTASSDSGGAEAGETTQAAPEQSPEDSEESATEDGSAAEEQDSADEGDDAAAGVEAGTLTITLDGEETTLTPDIVRCNGEPGTIRNVIIKGQEGELPLIKVTPGEFAMVKLDDQGEPEKSSSTTDITAEDDTITFAEATIGDAVVDGTVPCLQGEDD
ncbi:hypothetical protein CFK38_01940 [Brachybacterium vulturis]|uniref:Uncharacterized protein n=1 Tax=Brachybacterium vulturis TaxID=2017484 RepID=A0A291GK38_9MICO|nr:hypothetical protein [Brachybacterium vulturis]ATG50422.1 hypothetical protein CFK38_01940 [Brachybacterium vulturis]